MSPHTSSRFGNRVALALSVAALVTSVGFAGGPALARALNADTVDHLHAVGFGASTDARKGKLVATNRRTGRLPNNIIAVAPNSARLRGLPASAYLRKSQVNEVVQAGGLPPATPLPPLGTLTSGVSFTTTKPGRLLVDFTGSGQLQCPSASFVHWWIQLDGNPILSSRMSLGEAVSISFDYAGFPSIHLSGATTEVIPAGDHTTSLAGGCSGGANGGSASSGSPGVATITVLRSGSTLSPRQPVRARSSCVTTASGKTCR